jgi:hypothetical protein
MPKDLLCGTEYMQKNILKGLHYIEVKVTFATAKILCDVH